MASIQGFDKLNIVQRRSIPYAEYFGDMHLTAKQKKEREELALILEDYIMLFFSLIQSGASELTIRQEMTYELYKIVDEKGYFENEQQIDRYVAETVNNTYQSTVDNLREHPNDVILNEDVSEEEIEDILEETGDVPEDEVTPYWTSDDRAKFIAENESNTILNSSEYVEAKEKGFTHKIWMSYGDDRVRLTHQEVDGAKIPIGAYFDVGRARMLYPKDVTSELSTGAECPEEVCNCRCTVSYVK